MTDKKRSVTIKHNNPEDPILKYYIAELEPVVDEKGEDLLVVEDDSFSKAIIVEVHEDNTLIDTFGIPYFKDLPKEEQDKFLGDHTDEVVMDIDPEGTRMATPEEMEEIQ